MRAHLPPYDDPDPFVWVPDANAGAGAYFPLSRCEAWKGAYVLKEWAAAYRDRKSVG